MSTRLMLTLVVTVMLSAMSDCCFPHHCLAPLPVQPLLCWSVLTMAMMVVPVVETLDLRQIYAFLVMIPWEVANLHHKHHRSALHQRHQYYPQYIHLAPFLSWEIFWHVFDVVEPLGIPLHSSVPPLGCTSKTPPFLHLHNHPTPNFLPN